eukprot:gb/GECH01001134.1/.p1 GENE.gb/GECH01001134.1/~~gb/GECH01001134.1/.p1  ORF type:complete len:207 (+),score=44.44 gb/GECH01001134.1/:1-621(+)
MGDQVELKVVLVGAMGVGKTSIVSRYINSEFKDYLETTIGASYMSKSIQIREQTVKFSVWDTAGQEQYHSLVPLYFRKAAAVIVVYDISKQESFEDAKSWVKELQHQAPEDAIIVFTGNKSDLDIREVKSTDAERFASSINALCVETSAKTGDGVDQLFFKIGEKYLNYLEEHQSKIRASGRSDTLNSRETLTTVPTTDNSSRKCC